MTRKPPSLKDRGGVPIKDALETVEAGHPPIANGVILIDFDGTLYPFGYLFDGPKPIEGAIEFTQKLKSQGYTIVIFTSRLSKSWLESVNQTAQEHIDYISEVCTRDGIPFDSITAEKIPSIAYIDDKAVRFTGSWNDMDLEKYGVSL